MGWALAARVCPQPEASAPILVEEIGAGGERAQVAAFLLHKVGVCANESASDAAYDAFFNSAEMNSTATIIGLARNLVAACEEIGTGICVSVFVSDPSSYTILAQELVHTSVHADDPPLDATARSMRGGGGGGGVRGRAKRVRLAVPSS
ncbi:hypothetical protein ABPG75_008515 [Micractinium tetrahymenae]